MPVEPGLGPSRELPRTARRGVRHRDAPRSRPAAGSARLPPPRAQPRMGEHDGDQQRLLLAGRAVPAATPVSRWPHQQIGAVRAALGDAAFGVEAAAAPRRRGTPPRRRAPAWIEPGFDRAVERQPGARERARGGRRRRRAAPPPRRAPPPTATPCPAMSPRAPRARPGPPGAVAQQPRALAHRLLIGGEPRRMAGIECRSTSRSRKRRRRRAAPSMNSRSICGVSQAMPKRSASSAWLLAGVPSMRTLRRSPLRSQRSRPVPISIGRPRPVPLTASQGPRRRRDWLRRSISPSLARRRPRPGARKRHRLEQIGLARAVGAGQHHRPGVDGKPGARIAAEIGQHQTRDANRRTETPTGGTLIIRRDFMASMGRGRPEPHSLETRSCARSDAHRHEHVERAARRRLSRTTVGEAASASMKRAPSPSICSVMSSR